VEADRFSLQLGEDRALFIAEDALSFSYEAMPQLNKRQLLPVGGVMDKLRAGLRGDDNREAPGVVPPPPAPPSYSTVATTGKRLRELIKEASGYSTPVAETTTESAVETKGGHTLDAVLRRSAEDDSRLASEGLEDGGELSNENLLERLFAAPDHDLLDSSESSGDGKPTGDQAEGSLWTETAITVTEPAATAPLGKEPTPVAAPVTPPAVETWQKEHPPLEVWHKTDLSANPDSQLGSSKLADSPLRSSFGQSTWPFEVESRVGQADDVIAALNVILAEVRSGAMSTEQVQAVSSLIAAVTKALQLKL
jgi:hypothetical protein